MSVARTPFVIDRGTLAYLKSLVRMDVSKKQRGIAKFAPKPGQDQRSAAEALAHMREMLAYREQTLRYLNTVAESNLPEAPPAIEVRGGCIFEARPPGHGLPDEPWCKTHGFRCPNAP